MKIWRRDLIDHLLLMTQLDRERPLTRDEALDEVRQEFPELVPAESNEIPTS